MTSAVPIEYLDIPGRCRLACRFSPGDSPTVVFLGGFMADMEGSKAAALEAHCRGGGQSYLRFDYSGHGSSQGRFEDGTISSWLEDALAVIGRKTDGPLVLIGSSMGGWIALLAAIKLGARVKGLIGLAAAPDFTEELMWEGLDAGQRRELEERGFTYMTSDYGDQSYKVSRALIEDGRRHLLLGAEIPLHMPVRLLQGSLDPDVPAGMPRRISDGLASDDVQVRILEGGGHNLSRDQDIECLLATLDELMARLKEGGGTRGNANEG